MSETYDNWEELEEHIIEQETTRKINELARIENEKHRINTLNRTVEDIILTASDKVINDPRFTQIITEAIESEISQIGENTRNIAQNAEDIASINTALQMKYDLGPGEVIPEGADLNDYTAPGTYYTPDNTVTMSLLNKAEQIKGNSRLIVYAASNGSSVQNHVSNTSGIKAVRVLSASGEWGNWAYTETKNPYSLDTGVSIPSGSDLNDYLEPGTYYSANNATTQSLTNRPIMGGSDFNQGCILIVKKVTTGNVVMQTFISSGYGSTCVRRWADGVWQDWHQTSGIDSIVTEGTNGNWSYVKYANGNFYALCRIPQANYDFTTEHAGLYKTAEQTTTFPFSMVSTSYVGCSASSTNTLTSARQSNATTIAWRMFTNTSTTAAPLTVRLFVYGSWK